ncbi:MAG TPA: PAS domain S-box protein [Ignavibacteriales bacterium]|nr:PAS domain S-box protein [Ignavibacteriales bacterium]
MELKLQPAASYKKGRSVLGTLAVSKILIVIIFIIDIYLPLGYAVWILYLVPLIYVSIRLRNPLFTNLTLVLCIILIIAEFFLSRTVASYSAALFNAVVGISVFIFITFILNYKNSLEKKLAESEELFRQTFEQAGAGIVHFDTAGRWIRMNDKYCEIVGHRREELLHLSPNDIIHPEDLQKDLDCRLKLLSGEIKDYKIEKRYVRSDASVAWTIFSCTLMHDAAAGGKYFVGVVEDITRRKIEEEKFRRIAETMPLIVWTAEPSGELDFTNQWGLDFTGMSLNEIKGWGWLKMLHPDDLTQAEEKWKEALSTGGVFEDTALFRRHDGQYRWFLTRAVPLKNYSGKVTKWMGTSTDIHDQKESSDRLQEVMKELERSNKELEQFAYVASHDMKEPLRMVSSYLQLLAQKYQGRLDKNADDYIGYAVDGALRMSKLINDLLAYSRVSTKKRELTTVNLLEVVEDALGDLEVLITESRAVVIYKDLPTVKADILQMKQLFQNLIQNALKFRKSEGIKVEIDARKMGPEWIINVTDNGIGIDPEYYDRIFVIFQRLHGKDKYSGTGIGLALCKKIVERHGGRIWVESEPGRGSAFYFTLPAEG